METGLIIRLIIGLSQGMLIGFLLGHYKKNKFIHWIMAGIFIILLIGFETKFIYPLFFDM